jgi:hypothetical protein
MGPCADLGVGKKGKEKKRKRKRALRQHLVAQPETKGRVKGRGETKQLHGFQRGEDGALAGLVKGGGEMAALLIAGGLGRKSWHKPKAS